MHQLDYEPVICKTEEEARRTVRDLSKKGKWPCYFFKSDTTGEKDFEEFYTDNEILDLNRFVNIGVIKSALEFNKENLNYFLKEIENIKSQDKWNKENFVTLFNKMIPNFMHLQTNKYLDEEM